MPIFQEEAGPADVQEAAQGDGARVEEDEDMA